MIKADFFNLIARFAQRPMPALGGRHVYLWHGQLRTLTAALPGELKMFTLDLHQLAAKLPRTPRARDEARQLLTRAIQQQLKSQLETSSQQVFVVTGCDLLSRYQVSLRSFFQLASESRMIILVVSALETQFQPSGLLPSYVELDPGAPFEYLQTTLGVAATINMDEATS